MVKFRICAKKEVYARQGGSPSQDSVSSSGANSWIRFKLRICEIYLILVNDPVSETRRHPHEPFTILYVVY